MRALHDRVTGVTERVSVGSRRLQGDGPSEFHIAIARDGSFVVFSSTADNLVPNDTNDDWDVFLHQVPPPRELADHQRPANFCQGATVNPACNARRARLHKPIFA